MSSESEKKYVTSEELKTHNKPGDLWISIEGKVYDVSAWSKQHPGGDLPLLSLAGQDVTDAFIAYHPAAAWARLPAFFTGYHLRNYAVSPCSRDYRSLAAHLSRIGLFDAKGHSAGTTLAVTAVLFVASVYGIVFLRGALTHLLCAALLGCAWIQSGWIGHDSGHYRVMPGPRSNRFAQVLTGNCLAGISIAWWKRNHNAHHIACNSLDFDPDLQHMPLFAVSSSLFRSLRSYYYDRRMSFHPLARLLVSYQHLTFYPVMCLARLNLFAQSIVLLASPGKRVPDRAQEILGLVCFWVWFPLLVSCLPTWGERLMFVVSSFSVTGIQHVQFCLNHFSSSVYVGHPKGNDWFEKQTDGTLDISCPSWMDWFHGGLQFQVEHHLFPRLPRGQLRNAAPFVRQLCKEHGLPYTCVSFWEANVLTLGTLRTAALQARDLSNPLPKNLVWEALNTHG